ncbi:hypothetical protein BO70DRAFT_342415 [Aspergillus heteromorphus CBS 117.55]|uniref:Uncharacterized protein n=1 Tax=Aspergillus heteromorphus CBS 117.55 TaxID=1448321 RepID=A0A317VDD6_9EURO|nr:uncharacterized protein BO70DRAFT_342415 [Aspergillus heteromorphus CBS 117.55]PWY72383.1 hypothetical protein BO70DRAFT_342415 [Aspergillus heteromorphus CBS 117.55]
MSDEQRTSLKCLLCNEPGNSQEVSESPEQTEQSSDDEQSESDDDFGEWCPGDGVCPPSSQFDAYHYASYELWKRAVLMKPASSNPVVSYIEAFVLMLENVPPFFHNPPEGVNLDGGPKSPLTLQSSLRIGTTEDTSCDQSERPIDYFQCLGFPTPSVYKTDTETQLPATHLCSVPIRSRYLTSIILAWSYIISCRWVEILQQAGQKSLILHGQGAQLTECFWSIVIRSQWMAQVKVRKEASYAPWMLREERMEVERHHNSYWTAVSPNSSLAFEFLLEFCISEGLEAELLIGLASVLMLTSRNTPPPKLAPPIEISKSTGPFSEKKTIFHKIFHSIDKSISLSATQDAIDSLLCSAFFNPAVPCNCVSAASLGIKEALSLADGIDNERLLRAIAVRNPHLNILWTAAICTGQAATLLRLALKRLPPICLVAAFWTNTTQSFLQIAYDLDCATVQNINRAEEFKTSFFCRPHASVPWAPSPPFGTTNTQNLSLEVRAHISHRHNPQSWRIFWVLKNGARIPAGAQHQVNPCCVSIAQDAGSRELSREEAFENITSYKTDPSHSVPNKQMDDEQSWDATSRLFNWHRNHDDGIWLDDGGGDIEIIRRIQLHPWVVDPFDDNGQDEPVEADNHRELDRDSIIQWRSKVENHRQSGDISSP